MAGSKQMRAAWSRRTEEELLHAFFLEELTPEGRQVVHELVVEQYGPVDDFVCAFAQEQGQPFVTMRVRNCDIDAGIKGQAIPLMWGSLVLTSEGVGFIPAGHDDELAAHDLTSLGDFAYGPGGMLLGAVGDSILSGLKRTMRPVANHLGIQLPLPLLAKIEPNAIWLPHAAYDQVLWGPDFAEFARAGERLIALTPPQDAEPIVTEWAATYQIALSGVEPAPFLR